MHNPVDLTHVSIPCHLVPIHLALHLYSSTFRCWALLAAGLPMPPSPRALLAPRPRLARPLSFWSKSAPPPSSFSLVTPAPQAIEPFPISSVPSRIERPPYAESGEVDAGLLPAAREAIV